MTSMWEDAQTGESSLLRKLGELTDAEWRELTDRLIQKNKEEMDRRGYVIVRKSDWVALGGSLGRAPVLSVPRYIETCLYCGEPDEDCRCSPWGWSD